jgi:hypothetical protein
MSGGFALKALGWITGLDWKAVLQFALKYWWAILIVILGWLTWHRGNVIDARNATIKDLKTKITGYTEAIDTLSETLTSNKTELEKCQSVNVANQQGKAQAEADVQAAARKIADLTQALKAKNATTQTEGQTFNKGLTCPAYTPEFRQWLCHGTACT